MSDHDDDLYIVYIAPCLRDIARYTTTRSVFFNDLTTQDATLRKLQVMAESTQRLSTTLKVTAPDADWTGWSGFRNVLTHAYTTLDLDEIWDIIEQDVPRLKIVIDGIMQQRGLSLP
jgi:uncharacterized protein with HEPN domain